MKLNSLLTNRFRKASDKLSKMSNLVAMSSSGNLSSFSGVFRVAPLNDREKDALSSLLNQYKSETQEIGEDLAQLSALTAEVKAINNQAVILHGERIKKAQVILKNYQEGAFTAWLIATYGNRQTPYNFLQYYELYSALPVQLHPKLDEMPRQAVYSLASRSGDQEQKEQIIQSYSGQPKQELLQLIRETFPLAESDQRAQDFPALALSSLRRLQAQLARKAFSPTAKQREQFLLILKELELLIK